MLVPSYNSGAYLAAAVQSALEQGLDGVEVIVQDGGSSDGSLDALPSDDPRLRIARQPDRGQSDALNSALARAQGEWVVWLNADDLLAPGALALALAHAGPDVDLVYGHFELIDVDGNTIKTYRSAPLMRSRLFRRGTYIFSGTLLVRRDHLLARGAFDSSLHYCMDYDLLFRLTEETRSVHCQQVLARFRENPASKSSTAPWSFFWEHLKVSKRYGGWQPPYRMPSMVATVEFVVYILLRPLATSTPVRRRRRTKLLGG